MPIRPRIVAVVQARYSSQRLRGKMLRLMRGRPMLAYVLESLSHCRGLDAIAVATSTDPTDDPIVAYADQAGVTCHRGPLDDVAERLLEAGRAMAAHAVVRISGDSPLMDPALIDQAVALYRGNLVDIVSNVARRSFPKGQSIEVISCRALQRAIAEMSSAYEREHVTPHFYSHADRYVIRSFEAEHPRPDVQLSVDDAADFARCEAILDVLGRAPWQAGWEACVRAHDALLSRRLG